MVLIKFILFIIASTFAFSLNAQEVGVKGGLNLVNMYRMDNGNRSGDMAGDYHLGGYAEFKLGNVIFLQPELIYSREGAHKVYFFDIVFRLQLNFIQAPLLVKLKAADWLNFYLGPQVGFLITQKIDDIGKLDGIEYKKIALSAVGGIGLQLNEKFEVGGRYNFGLTNWRDNVDEVADAYRETGRTIQVYLSYRILDIADSAD
ncbi:MAG: porin family protein [Cyclobacteriaceae bacterium]